MIGYAKSCLRIIYNEDAKKFLARIFSIDIVCFRSDHHANMFGHTFVEFEVTYYNERNGWVDNGKLLDPKNIRCPNCRGNNYIETVSREYCPDCGMECDYWGSGSNEVYDNMCQRKWDEERKQQEEEFRKQYGDEYNEQYD